jgi:hypothetical protein
MGERANELSIQSTPTAEDAWPLSSLGRAAVTALRAGPEANLVDAYDTTARPRDDRDEEIRRLKSPLTSTGLLHWVDRRRVPLLIGVLLVYLAGFNGQWRMSNDSSAHLVIARNITEGHGYTHPGNLQEHLAPGLSYLIAGIFRLFGTDSLTAAVAVMWLTSLLVLALTYCLFDLVGGRAVAVLMTCLLALNELFYSSSFRLLTDMPFLAGAMLVLVGYERLHRTTGSRVWNVILMVVGFLEMAAFRSVVLVFAVAMLVTLVIELVRRRRHGALAGACVLLLATVGAARWADPNLDHPFQLTEDEQFLKARLLDNLPQTLSELVSNTVRVTTEGAAEVLFALDFGFMAVPLSLMALACTLTLVRVRLLWFVLIATFLCQWLMVIVTQRYFLPILPLLVFAWWRGAVWVEHRLPSRWAARALALMMAFLVVPNVVRIGDLIIEQQSRPFHAYYRNGKYDNPSRLAVWMLENTEPEAMIIAPRDYCPLLLYLSRRHTVSSVTKKVKRAKFVYAAFPADDSIAESLHRRRWTLSEPLITIAGDKPSKTWTLQRVIRPGESPPE